jgi:hypothetical protein
MFDDVEKSEVSEVEGPREIVNSVQRTVTEVWGPIFSFLFPSFQHNNNNNNNNNMVRFSPIILISFFIVMCIINVVNSHRYLLSCTHRTGDLEFKRKSNR